MAMEGEGTFIGAGSSEVLARSFVNAGQLAYVAFRPDGTIVFASENIESITGHSSLATVGTNVLEEEVAVGDSVDPGERLSVGRGDRGARRVPMTPSGRSAR